MKTNELIEEIMSLPVEERVMIADFVLRSLNPFEAVIDEKWAEVAIKRRHELHSGKVTTIPGKEVFEKINNRFSE